MASELHVDAIKHSGGTSAMTIDSTGRVLTPARPFFHVYVDNGGTNPSMNTLNIIPFDGVVSNIGGHFNATNSGNNYSFTAPIAGIYQFNWNLSFYNVTVGNYMRQRVFVNGASYQFHEYKDSQTTGDQNVSTSFAILLSANDYVQFFAQAQNAFNLSAGTFWNFCTGYLVG